MYRIHSHKNKQSKVSNASRQIRFSKKQIVKSHRIPEIRWMENKRTSIQAEVSLYVLIASAGVPAAGLQR